MTEAVKAAKRRAMPEPMPDPHTCAACIFLNDSGYCTAVLDYPPVDFLEKNNDCEQYEQAPPF